MIVFNVESHLWTYEGKLATECIWCITKEVKEQENSNLRAPKKLIKYSSCVFHQVHAIFSAPQLGNCLWNTLFVAEIKVGHGGFCRSQKGLSKNVFTPESKLEFWWGSIALVGTRLGQGCSLPFAWTRLLFLGSNVREYELERTIGVILCNVSDRGHHS